MKIKSHGLGTSPLANMTLAEEAIIEHDIESRKRVGDFTNDCEGILRKNDHLRGPTMWLWGIQSLVMLAEFSRNERLVAYLDSTKMGNLGFQGTPVGKKLLYTKMLIQPGYGFIRGSDRELFYSQFFKGVKVAELISTKNKTQHVNGFILAISDDVFKCTGIKLKFNMIHTDMAP